MAKLRGSFRHAGKRILDADMPLEYYLALLQVHIAVVGLVIAGALALVQLLNNTKPHRSVSLLLPTSTLVAFGGLLTGLLVLLVLGTWSSAFPDSARLYFGDGWLNFFADGIVGLMIIVLSLGTLAWFGYLAVMSRDLLDAKRYLQAYVRAMPAVQVRHYLAAIYAANSQPRAIPFDPFQPIREYIKDNAFMYYDYGTADGLKQFSRLYDKALDDVSLSAKQQTGHDPEQDEFVRLARYMSESSVELFSIFVKTASEKRKLDTINLLYQKGEAMLTTGSDAALLPIVRGLEAIAKLSDDDDETIAAITSIGKLCDVFLYNHRRHDWAHVAGPFDEICLSVTRISETYYLQKNNSLKTVPIVGFATGEHRSVTAALVDFFTKYGDLADRYKDTMPVSYFDAIEGVVEVLFIRLGDIVSGGRSNVGFNMVYHDLARDLYQIYYAFGIDAIEHGKPELLTLALGNLRRVIKPAKNFKLVDERARLCDYIVELAAKGCAAFGDITIKDTRTISDYAVQTLDKHANLALITAAIDQLTADDVDLAKDKAVKKLFARLKAVG